MKKIDSEKIIEKGIGLGLSFERMSKLALLIDELLSMDNKMFDYMLYVFCLAGEIDDGTDDDVLKKYVSSCISKADEFGLSYADAEHVINVACDWFVLKDNELKWIKYLFKNV